MKILIILIIILIETERTFANNDFLKNSSEALNYVFSPNNDEKYIGVSLQLEDNYNSFLINLKSNIFEGVGDSKNQTVFTLMPSVGYMFINDINSKHRLNLRLSAGFTNFRQKKSITNGFGSETNLEYRYNNFSINLGYLNINYLTETRDYYIIGVKYYYYQGD